LFLDAITNELVGRLRLLAALAKTFKASFPFFN
jgi:hypothetical protein